MIGVITRECEQKVVSEFFQLFKTPWEHHQDDRKYEVIIITTDELPSSLEAPLILFYNSKPTPFDLDESLAANISRENNTLEHGELSLPIYGQVSTFLDHRLPYLALENSKRPVTIKLVQNKRCIVRIGYDLFFEINQLLSSGQPVEFAAIPTLDRHIAIMRNIIVNEGSILIEIPPVPYGYNFTVCLTHDVDFVALRNHFFDHTFFGFLYRSVFGSFFRLLRKRITFNQLLQNWFSVLSLPGIFLGLIKDFWIQFDRYLEIENSLPSTYFFVPLKDWEGSLEHGTAPGMRAVKYDINDIKEHIKNLIDAGREIGLHSLDAWIDDQGGREEAGLISQMTGSAEMGNRMHWLYFQEQSPQKLEAAGFKYDSSLGYNETIGFRNGTAQPFAFLSTKDLIELPLHIMDTALFYPDHMNLSEGLAWKEVENIIDHFSLYGGVLTLNWHQRSLAPERLWGDFYLRCLQMLQTKGACFMTAMEAVNWFKFRRSIEFEEVKIEEDKIFVHLRNTDDHLDPKLFLRLNLPVNDKSRMLLGRSDSTKKIDISISNHNPIKISLSKQNEYSTG